MPVHGNDYVYTLPITRASLNRQEIVNNAAAALLSDLPWQPLGWRAITMYVDPRTRTTATLFGNDVALRVVARGDAAHTQPPSYPAGSVLALVTWAQRDDPHWFGGRIPDRPLAVEFVQVASGKNEDAYRAFEGDGLAEAHVETKTAAQSRDFILNLAPAPLP